MPEGDSKDEALSLREAEVAAQTLRDFAEYIRHNQGWNVGRRSPGPAIAAAASSRASEILSTATGKVDKKETIESELASLLNRYSQENSSGTPDFILANFLLNVLYHYEETIQHRAKWRGESVELPALQSIGKVPPLSHHG